MIRIPNPDPKLLKALADAGVLPPGEQTAAKTRKPSKSPTYRRSNPMRRHIARYQQKAAREHRAWLKRQPDGEKLDIGDYICGMFSAGFFVWILYLLHVQG